MKRAILLLTTAGLLTACSDDRVIAPRQLPPPPMAGIWDAMHDGNDHFFWLPPMVSQPPTSRFGTFETGLNPTLQLVCYASNDADSCTPGDVIVQFAIGSGMTVHTDHYQANVSVSGLATTQSDREAFTTYRLIVWTPALPGVEPAQLGFADIEIGENGREARNLSNDETIGLVDGRTLPVRFRIDRGAMEIALASSTADLGDQAVCTEACSVTVISPDEDTEAFLEVDGKKETAIFLQQGDLSETAVLLIDKRDDTELGGLEGEIVCAPGTTGAKKNCYRYLITGEGQFNNPVRVGVCPAGVPLGEGTLWRLLKATDGVVTRLPEVDVSDFLPCPGDVAMNRGALGRLAMGVLNRLVRPLYAADTRLWGGHAEDLSDIYFGLEGELEAESTVGAASAGSTLPVTARVLAAHPREHDAEAEIAVEEAVLVFLITAGSGELAAPEDAIELEDARVLDNGRLVGISLRTDSSGRATADWTLGDGSNQLTVASPDAEGPDGTPIVINVTGMTFAATRFCPNVVNGSSSTFDTFEQSLAAVQPGGTVSVCAGEHVVQDAAIDRPVVIEGEGDGTEAVIDGDGAVSSLRIDGVPSGGVTIRNLTFRNTTYGSVWAVGEYDQVVVEQNRFLIAGVAGVVAQQPQIEGSLVLVTQNVFTGGGSGTFAPSARMDVVDNDFSGHSFGGIQYQTEASGRVENNRLVDCGPNGCIRGVAISNLAIIGNRAEAAHGGIVQFGIIVRGIPGATFEIRDNEIVGIGAIIDPADPTSYAFIGAGIALQGLTGGLSSADVTNNVISNVRRGITAQGAVQVTGADNVVDAVFSALGVGFDPEQLAGGRLLLQRNDFTGYEEPIDFRSPEDFEPGDLACNWWGNPAGPVNWAQAIDTAVYVPFATAPIANTTDTCPAATSLALTDVVLSTTTLTIGGPAVSYSAIIENHTGESVSTVVLQGWTEQGTARRAAGGTQVNCGGAGGEVPPGTCQSGFSFLASNETGGEGTLVAGSATAVIELRSGGVVVDEVRIPITLQ